MHIPTNKKLFVQAHQTNKPWFRLPTTVVLPFSASSWVLSVICARSRFTNQLLLPLLSSSREIGKPLILSFKPWFPIRQPIPHFCRASRVKLATYFGSPMLFAPPLHWIKQMTLVFELVQVPVAPPRLWGNSLQQPPFMLRQTLKVCGAETCPCTGYGCGVALIYKGDTKKGRGTKTSIQTI